MPNRAEWMKNKKWGVMTHYLYNLCECGVKSRFMPEVTWNECVNSFNVKEFAKNLADVGAGYLIFTIMQGYATMCAPNETFNKLTGYKPGEACSERDLIMELSDELAKYDIDLVLYFTGDGPYKDEKAGTALGYHDMTKDLVSAEFVNKWASVLEEYSVRYGKRIKGWWIDGCYNYFGFDDTLVDRDALLKKFKDAALKGNPDGVIGFNGGVMRCDLNNPAYSMYTNGLTHPLAKLRSLEAAVEKGDELAKKAFTRPGPSRHTIHDDYTAGEENQFMFFPDGNMDENLQWHILSFIAPETGGADVFGYSGWSGLGSKYSKEELHEYVEKVTNAGGAVTVDIAIFRDGSLDKGQLEVLKGLKDIRK